MINDGCRVAYVGPEEGGLTIGLEGRVLMAEAAYSHVRWDHSADVCLVVNEDLVAMATRGDDGFDASLMGGINVTAVYAQHGSIGLLNVLSREGHLMSFPAICDAALAFISGRVRQDPSVSEVIGRLDHEDAEEFVSMATMAVMRQIREG